MRSPSAASSPTSRSSRDPHTGSPHERSNDDCELDAPAEEGFGLFFPDYDALLAYCKKRFKRWP